MAKRRTGVNLGRLIFRELHNRLGGRLRLLASGGAALNPEVQRNYLRLGLPLIQGWGMSEASPGVAAQRWNPRKFCSALLRGAVLAASARLYPASRSG